MYVRSNSVPAAHCKEGCCRQHPTNKFQLRNERNVISTPLSTSDSSIDYATRLAKILARKTKQPVYVGCSMTFTGTTAEEEMEGFTAIVDQIMQRRDQTS